MEKKIYFAYGSNLNHRQMAYRCPDAEFVGTGFIKDHTLTFKGDNSGVADIIPCSGGRVPVGVWKISSADERRLDLYEGYPRLYGKRAVRAVCGGKSIDGMVYVMMAQKPVKLPSETYFNVILEGYSDCGIDCEALFDFMFNVQKSLDFLS